MQIENINQIKDIKMAWIKEEEIVVVEELSSGSDRIQESSVLQIYNYWC